MKVAIVHEMLIKMGGAENVVKDMLELFPDADLYTLVYDEKKVSTMFPVGSVKYVPKITQRLYNLTKNQRFCLPFMARAVESIDLSNYDLVIASSSGFAHGCITKPETLFITYYHTPSRYLWDWTFEHRKDMNYKSWFKIPLLFFLSILFHKLRIWDYQAGQRCDIPITVTKHVQKRIAKYYRRDSQIIHPSVYSDIFSIGEKILKERDYYIVIGALTEFKKIDIAVKAFNSMSDLKLIVIGDGLHRKYLESIAGPNIEFVGYKHWEESNEYYKNAKGSLLCNKEDFGIIPLEAMCAGVPVFGLRDGGLTETSVEGLTGEFFDKSDGSDFIDKFRKFDANIMNNKYNSIKIRNHALKFRRERFLEELYNVVSKYL